MKNIAVLDPILGDSGKGRVTHWFAPNYDWVIRPNSGSNAGHQIHRNGKKYSHHLLPCADYNHKTKSYLASGMMINLEELLAEIELFEPDYPELAKSIYVDQDAFIVSQKHIDIDKENNKHLMTTGKGMGPATVDKYSRSGARIYNLINDNAEIITKLKNKGVNFTTLLAMRETFERSRLLFEGAQGVLLDLQRGIYPYVTAADTTVAAISSAGFHFVKLDKVFGVIKPYWTKSGAGPLPTEMNEEEAKLLREKAGEYGVTTGRDRRIGHMDLPMLKYGVAVGGITHLIVTKMDILEGEKFVTVCHSYDKEIHSPNDFQNVHPMFMDISGWKNARNLEQTKAFRNLISEKVGVPISHISVGVSDSDMIEIKESAPERMMDPFSSLADFGISKLDSAFKKIGYPTLSEIMMENIKSKIGKN